MKNILVAIDFSNATDAVIHQIGKLACPNDSIIHLLHIPQSRRLWPTLAST